MKASSNRLTATNPELWAVQGTKTGAFSPVLTLDLHEWRNAKNRQDIGIEVATAGEICDCEVYVVKHVEAL